jgi:signal transduction histidine kinase
MNAAYAIRKAVPCETASEPDERVGDLRHELNTPLTSIRAFSEIVLNNPEMDLARRQQFLQIVIEEAEKLTHRLDEALVARPRGRVLEWGLSGVQAPAQDEQSTLQRRGDGNARAN